MKKKKYRIKKRVIYSFSIFLLLLIGSGLFICLKNFDEKSDNNESKELIDTDLEDDFIEEEVVEDPIKEYNFSLIMGGDALIHSAVYAGAEKNGGYDFKPMLEYIKPIIKEYDLAYYNQETILGGKELGLSTYPRFNSPYEVGDAFIDAGFNIVSLANNHTLDRGESAIINSRKYWNNKDVMVNGSATSMDEKNKIDIKEKNGITYTMLSYTTTTNMIPRKNDYFVNFYEYEKVKKDIESIRPNVDVLMVAIHWGVEGSTGVSSEQKRIAKELADMGVNIVIGCHPHVIEPVEYIGNTFVIYSLGNFISAQKTTEQLSGLLMSVNVKKVVDTEKGETTISVVDPTAQFIYTNKAFSNGTKYKLYPYSMLNDNILSGYKSMYDKLKKRITSLDERVQVVELSK